MGLFVFFFLEQKDMKMFSTTHHISEKNIRLLKRIFKGNELPDDISIYLHRPTATDKVCP